MTGPVLVGLLLCLLFEGGAVVVHRQLRERRAKSRIQSTIAMWVLAVFGAYTLAASAVVLVRD